MLYLIGISLSPAGIVDIHNAAEIPASSEFGVGVCVSWAASQRGCGGELCYLHCGSQDGGHVSQRF